LGIHAANDFLGMFHPRFGGFQDFFGESLKCDCGRSQQGDRQAVASFHRGTEGGIMKKIALAGVVALGIVALSQQQASAWVNAKFSIGLNWQWQCGNNNFLWGAWHNGQVPGPEAFGSGPVFTPMAPYYYHHHHAPMPVTFDILAQQYANPQPVQYP